MAHFIILVSLLSLLTLAGLSSLVPSGSETAPALWASVTDVRVPRITELYEGAGDGTESQVEASVASGSGTRSPQPCEVGEPSHCHDPAELPELETTWTGRPDLQALPNINHHPQGSDPSRTEAILEEIKHQSSQALKPWTNHQNIAFIRSIGMEDLLLKSRVGLEMGASRLEQHTLLTQDTLSEWRTMAQEWNAWSLFNRYRFKAWWAAYWEQAGFMTRWTWFEFNQHRASSPQKIWWSASQISSWIASRCNWMHIVKVGDLLHLDKSDFPSLDEAQRQEAIHSLQTIFLSEQTQLFRPHALRWGLSDGSLMFMNDFQAYHSRLAQILKPNQIRQRFLEELKDERPQVDINWDDPALITLWAHRGIEPFHMTNFGKSIRLGLFGIRSIRYEEYVLFWYRLSRIFDPAGYSRLQIRAVREWYSELLGQETFDEAVGEMWNGFRWIGRQLIKRNLRSIAYPEDQLPLIDGRVPSTSHLTSRLLRTSWSSQNKRVSKTKQSVELIDERQG